MLDRSTFDQLAQPSHEHAVVTYGEVAHGLFDSIANGPMHMTHSQAQE
jgi:hypothetical protein